jgi:hypothetical protein
VDAHGGTGQGGRLAQRWSLRSLLAAGLLLAYLVAVAVALATGELLAGAVVAGAALTRVAVHAHGSQPPHRPRGPRRLHGHGRLA